MQYTMTESGLKVRTLFPPLPLLIGLLSLVGMPMPVFASGQLEPPSQFARCYIRTLKSICQGISRLPIPRQKVYLNGFIEAYGADYPLIESKTLLLVAAEANNREVMAYLIGKGASWGEYSFKGKGLADLPKGIIHRVPYPEDDGDSDFATIADYIDLDGRPDQDSGCDDEHIVASEVDKFLFDGSSDY